jgi:hypothetical protein
MAIFEKKSAVIFFPIFGRLNPGSGLDPDQAWVGESFPVRLTVLQRGGGRQILGKFHKRVKGRW